MNSEVTKDNIVVVNDDPKFFAPRDRLEKKSGISPVRARMTNLTFSTFIGSIKQGRIPKQSEVLNARLKEIRENIIETATEEAEKSIRESVIGTEIKSATSELDAQKMLEDQKLFDATSVNAISNIFTNNNAILTESYLDGQKNNALRTSLPRAIRVKGNLSKACRIVGKKTPSYINEIQKRMEAEEANSSWKRLFDGVTLIHEPVEEEQNEVKVIRSTAKKIDTSFKSRIVKAQIGDELNDVRRLLNGIGKNTPFNAGLQERERELLRMLSETAGISLNIEKTTVPEDKKTEMQALIEGQVGYVRPLTEEEYKEKAQDVEEYYSDPFVQQNISDLAMKNILFDMNQPESYEKITRAERFDNERRAEMSSAIELLEENTIITKSNKEVPKFTVTEEIAKEARKTAEDIIRKAHDEELAEAKKIEEEKQLASLKNDAKVQAAMLQRKNEEIELYEGAQEQAELLNRVNLLLDGAQKQAELLIKQEKEENFLKIGAEEQARMLLDLNILLDGANEQAQMLFGKEQNEAMLEDARKEALNIQRLNTLIDDARNQAYLLAIQNQKIDFLNDAELEARRIYDRNNIAIGAEEQAKILFELGKIIDDAQKQAQMLMEQDKNAELLSGAEEQARMLQQRNEQIELLNGAEEQAKMLQQKNEQIELLNGAEEQAKMLQQKNEQIELLNGAEEQARMLQQEAEREKLREDSLEEAKAIMRRNEEERKKYIYSPPYQITETEDRYGQVVSYPQPIRIAADKLLNLKRKTRKKMDPTSALISLREQLEQMDFDDTPNNDEQKETITFDLGGKTMSKVM